MKEELRNEILQFMDSIRGRETLTYDERRNMFQLYNRWYNASETQYDCELCWIRVHTKLNNIK